VIFSDISQDRLAYCQALAQQRGVCERYWFLQASADDLSALDEASIDMVTTRSVLIYEGFAELRARVSRTEQNCP
jgi:arsenite methyltransferase